VELTRLEFDLLAQLAGRPAQVFSRQLLADQVWGRLELTGDLASVTEVVRRTRQKLEAAGPSDVRIETVRGVGYRLVVAEAG
jgi:two-component system response regulator MtrA